MKNLNLKVEKIVTEAILEALKASNSCDCSIDENGYQTSSDNSLCKETKYRFELSEIDYTGKCAEDIMFQTVIENEFTVSHKHKDRFKLNYKSIHILFDITKLNLDRINNISVPGSLPNDINSKIVLFFLRRYDLTLDLYPSRMKNEYTIFSLPDDLTITVGKLYKDVDEYCMYKQINSELRIPITEEQANTWYIRTAIYTN